MRLRIFRRAPASALVAVLLLTQTFARQQQQSNAQTQAPQRPFELTVDSIMRGPDLVGYQPAGVYWSQDNSRVYFRWKRAGEPRLKEQDLYVVGADGTGLRRLTEEEARRSPPAAGELSKDKTLTVFTEEGDVFLYDHAKGERRQLTKTVEAESNAHFTRDQRGVYFTRASNLYRMSLDGGALEQLTDIRVPAPPSAGGAGAQQRAAGENQEYLRKEERRLLEVVRERAEQREEVEKRRREREARRAYTVPVGQNVMSLTLAPDGASVVMTLGEQTSGKGTIVPNYVTESGYTEDIPGRTKEIGRA